MYINTTVHSIHSYMFRPSEWPSWGSTDTFCEQGQRVQIYVSD
jgi:hypothetical protein